MKCWLLQYKGAWLSGPHSPICCSQWNEHQLQLWIHFFFCSQRTGNWVSSMSLEEMAIVSQILHPSRLPGSLKSPFLAIRLCLNTKNNISVHMIISNMSDMGKLPVNVFPISPGDNNMEVMRTPSYFNKCTLFISMFSLDKEFSQQ